MSFVFAQGDCPSYPQAECQNSIYCTWSNGACIWDDDKTTGLDEVTVVACKDKTKVYNPETKACETKQC
ncbi:MAG: hypothetical protein LBH96_03180 [Candidatus Peribacteria bacterium]|nr:hypothetical protein [Candidatus Peribacteria bacterium]